MPEQLTIITTSVNYSDYLRLTLPEAVKYGRVIVATSPDDKDTIAVSAACGAECFQTNAWTDGKAPFRKGAGINAAIEYAKPEGWLLLLDSDIILTPPPPDFVTFDKLDTTCLYGVRRRSCPEEDVWRKCMQQNSWYALPVDPLPPLKRIGKKMKVWGSRPWGSGEPRTIQSKRTKQTVAVRFLP